MVLAKDVLNNFHVFNIQPYFSYTSVLSNVIKKLYTKSNTFSK